MVKLTCLHFCKKVEILLKNSPYAKRKGNSSEPFEFQSSPKDSLYFLKLGKEKVTFFQLLIRVLARLCYSKLRQNISLKHEAYTH